MSWQKGMSFSKCSDLDAEKVIHFKLCHQRDKRPQSLFFITPATQSLSITYSQLNVKKTQ